MKILNKTVEKITTETYEIEYNGQKYVYIDFVNEGGKAIDSVLRTEDGYAVEVPSLFEEIQEFVDDNAWGSN